MKVSKVGPLPDPKPTVPGGKESTDWAALAAALEKNPGHPVLMDGFTQTPRAESIVTSLKRSPMPRPLRGLDGTITVNIRNSTTDPVTRHLTGDVWVTFTPKEG